MIAVGVLSSFCIPVFAQEITTFCRTHVHAGSQVAEPVTGKIPSLLVHELEPAGVRGRNDDQRTAEPLGELGAGSSIRISGMLSPVPPILKNSPEWEIEDDGAIHLARDVNLLTGTRIQIQGMIGDGPHGSSGGGTGDFDFYQMGELYAGQRISIDVDTPPGDPGLDSKVALYNSIGQRLAANDNGIADEKDSYLEFIIAADGSYFAVIRGINSWWPGDPFDPSSGPKVGSEGPYTLTLGVDAEDLDWFSVDLKAGDVLSTAAEDAALQLTFAERDGTVLLAAGLDRSDLLPRQSPLLKGGNANLALVIARTGRYDLRVAHGSGSYFVTLAAYRAGPDNPADSQILFIDFDGAELDGSKLGGRKDAKLSPLQWFLQKQGMGHQEDQVIDRALSVLTENLIDDLQGVVDADFSLEIQNSRDDPDSWGASNVSRVIVGGTQSELGLQTIGIAESVDVGNFVLNETAVVLLDRMTDPLRATSFAAVERAPGVSLADLLGLALGNIIAHEVGHLLASFHTGHPDAPWQIMDASPEPAGFLGAGPDKILGNMDDLDVDFGTSPYWELEGFTGVQDSRSSIVYGLRSLSVASGFVEPFPSDRKLQSRMIGELYPNPAYQRVWLPIMLERSAMLELDIYDLLGRLQMTVNERVQRSGDSEVSVPVDGLVPGMYIIRVKLGEVMVTRRFVIIR